MRTIVASLALAVLCAAAQLTQAEVPGSQPADSPPTDVIQVIKLTLAPATQPQPATKYKLLPPLDDQVPGDGIALYFPGLQMVESWMRGVPKLSNNLLDWKDMPADQLPLKEVRSTVEDAENYLKPWTDQAARHPLCEWNLPVKQEGVGLLLPWLPPWRTTGQLVQLRSRLAAIDGRFDDAVRSMQTGFAMARHVANEPVLIPGLVGAAIAQLMFQAVEDIQQQPGSPNLYWALADLPRPLVDLRTSLQGEASMLYYTFPELREGQAGKLSPPQWDALLRKVVQMHKLYSSKDEGNQDPFIEAMRAYPQAKQWFLQQGYSAEQVEAMPVGRVILQYSLHYYEILMGDQMKWFGVPYPQGWRGIRQAQQRLNQATRDGLIPLLGFFLTDFTSVYDRLPLLEKRVGALQCIEAIRLYMASHAGRPPGSLDDITEVPVPLNPMTGKPFAYRLEGDKAILESFAPPEASKANLHYYVRYELTIRK